MPKTTKPKPRRPESATCYAIRKGRKWWTGRVTGSEWSGFADAFLFDVRPVPGPGCVAVPCRVRPLPSAKRNRTRTR